MPRWVQPFRFFWLIYLVVKISDRPNWFWPVLGYAVVIAAIYWTIKWIRRPKSEVEFVLDESPQARLAIAGARCLICRHELGRDVIYCGRCHTPHHRECYAYTGGCSLYACRSRKAA